MNMNNINRIVNTKDMNINGGSYRCLIEVVGKLRICVDVVAFV